ncbi:transcription termination factor NusA [Chlamydiales bacterium]|nr:transcription termination factor NusA [Chlamydiales bacterium]
MNKDLIAIFEYLEREKGIKREIIISAIEESLEAAAKKSVHGASNVTVKINHKSGDIDVFSEKEIVEEVDVHTQEISLEDAKEIDPDCEIGQFIDIIVTPKDFGRIAAQKARNIISQKLRGAERDVIYDEYRHRANELVSGSIKRFVRGANLLIDLGKVDALLPMRNYPKTEKWRVGDKVLALLLGVEDTENGGAQVVLSRSHPEFVRQLFLQEIPEITDGSVKIENIVREAGYRTKVVVSSSDSRVDPVGACVGMRGMRVKNIVRELSNEKVDIIPFANDPIELLQNALNPIEIRKISVIEDDNLISIVVDDDDYAITVGKRRQNQKLNSHLIGYDLEVNRMTDYNVTQAIQQSELVSNLTLDEETLDKPLTGIEGINQLVFEQLATEGYATLRSLLLATPHKLSQVPGISLEMAEKILEAIRKGQ